MAKPLTACVRALRWTTIDDLRIGISAIPRHFKVGDPPAQGIDL
jgi:hypothetical protein